MLNRTRILQFCFNDCTSGRFSLLREKKKRKFICSTKMAPKRIKVAVCSPCGKAYTGVDPRRSLRRHKATKCTGGTVLARSGSINDSNSHVVKTVNWCSGSERPPMEQSPSLHLVDPRREHQSSSRPDPCREESGPSFISWKAWHLHRRSPPLEVGPRTVAMVAPSAPKTKSGSRFRRRPPSPSFEVGVFDFDPLAIVHDPLPEATSIPAVQRTRLGPHRRSDHRERAYRVFPSPPTGKEESIFFPPPEKKFPSFRAFRELLSDPSSLADSVYGVKPGPGLACSRICETFTALRDPPPPELRTVITSSDLSLLPMIDTDRIDIPLSPNMGEEGDDLGPPPFEVLVVEDLDVEPARVLLKRRWKYRPKNIFEGPSLNDRRESPPMAIDIVSSDLLLSPDSEPGDDLGSPPYEVLVRENLVGADPEVPSSTSKKRPRFCSELDELPVVAIASQNLTSPSPLDQRKEEDNLVPEQIPLEMVYVSNRAARYLGRLAVLGSASSLRLHLVELCPVLPEWLVDCLINNERLLRSTED